MEQIWNCFGVNIVTNSIRVCHLWRPTRIIVENAKSNVLQGINCMIHCQFMLIKFVVKFTL